MIRVNLSLETASEISEFVSIINSDGSTSKYVLEDFDGSFTVNARSYLGVLYATAEFGDLYLINATNDGSFPNGIDKFRKLEH